MIDASLVDRNRERRHRKLLGELLKQTDFSWMPHPRDKMPMPTYTITASTNTR